MKIYKSVLWYLLFVICLAIPPVILLNTGNGFLIVPHFWVIFAFVSGLTLISIILILIIQKLNNEMYTAAFLGATTFKLLSCLVFVLIFTKKSQPEKLPFVVDFMYIYFLNMAFEIWSLLSNLRNQNLK